MAAPGLSLAAESGDGSVVAGLGFLQGTDSGPQVSVIVARGTLVEYS